MIGDSCGSFHQFADKELSDVEMDFCLSLPGGGPFQLNPGQVTDDGELIMCQLQAFNETGAENKIDIDNIAEWYKQWAASTPFDKDETINETLILLHSED